MNNLEIHKKHGRPGMAAVMVWGVAPLVALAVRFDIAVYFALIALVITLLVALFVHIVWDLVPPSWLLAYVMVFAAFLVTLTEVGLQLFAPNLLVNFGIFLPILAVSPLVMINVEFAQTESGLGERLKHIGAIMVRFVLLMIGMALTREILASGTLTLNSALESRLQLVVPGLVDAPIGLLATGCGGMILAGLLLALRNWLIARKSTAGEKPQEQMEAGS